MKARQDPDGYVGISRDDGKNRQQRIVHCSFRSFVAAVFLCLLCFALAYLSPTLESLSIPQDVKNEQSSKNNKSCLSVCQLPLKNRPKIFALGSSSKKTFVDATPQDVVAQVQLAKDQLLDKLYADYGEKYFNEIYVDEDGSYRPITPCTIGGDSWHQLKRKLKLKILAAQLSAKQQQLNVHGCNCVRKEGAQEDLNVSDNQETLFEKYVWATGGHSASAGHGNMFNESYTAYMERDLKDVFGSAGIKFEGRNYAMGGTSCAAEVAMCWEEIFGTDVDAFSWDYGMTDSGNYGRLFFYGYRGGLSNGHPAFVGINLRDSKSGKRLKNMQQLEELGLAAFVGNTFTIAKQTAAVPDSSILSTAEIEGLPDYVRSFRCGEQIEKGEPFCSKEKYTTYACNQRKGGVSWHPGYKYHAMIGHGLSLFMVEVLLAAAKEIATNSTTSYEALHIQLSQEDEDQFNMFKNASMPLEPKSLFQVPSDVDVDVLFKSRSFCHTARTPSRSRYLGYLTDTDKVGFEAPVGNETYFVGIQDEIALENPAMNGEMRLAWSGGKEREICNYTVKPDYKDFFFTTDKDGWTSLIFPNAAERKVYHYDPMKINGIIVLVLKACSWGKCEAGFLNHLDLNAGKWQMKINGVAVVSLSELGHGALIAQGRKGSHFQPNKDGFFNFEIKVNEKDSFVKVSSFIIY